MNYGNPKTATGGVLVATGASLFGQIGLAIAVGVIVIVTALAIRYKWRKGKDINE